MQPSPLNASQYMQTRSLELAAITKYSQHHLAVNGKPQSSRAGGGPARLRTFVSARMGRAHA
jgi:hypothetical protein